MKFGELREYDKINIFLQKPCRKWGKEASFELLIVFKKAFYEIKPSGLFLVSIYFDSPQHDI